MLALIFYSWHIKKMDANQTQNGYEACSKKLRECQSRHRGKSTDQGIQSLFPAPPSLTLVWALSPNTVGLSFLTSEMERPE